MTSRARFTKQGKLAWDRNSKKSTDGLGWHWVGWWWCSQWTHAFGV